MLVLLIQISKYNLPKISCSPAGVLHNKKNYTIKKDMMSSQRGTETLAAQNTIYIKRENYFFQQQAFNPYSDNCVLSSFFRQNQGTIKFEKSILNFIS